MTTLKKQIIDARSIIDNGCIEQYGYYRLHKLLDKMEEYIDESKVDEGARIDVGVRESLTRRPVPFVDYQHR